MGPLSAVTMKTIRSMSAKGEPFACLTCYDATTAGLLERAGVHVLLVGDSAAEVILGFERTIDMPLEFAIVLTAAVKRGAPSRLVMADMPFMSYHADEGEAIRNAGRFMTEGRADVVKLEVDSSFGPLVEKLTRAGVPVVAHIGSKPQQAGLKGGYGGAGRTPVEAEAIVQDAVAMQAAGAVMLLIEAVPETVTRRVLQATSIPLIGIGAGAECHGQVLVVHDLLGLSKTPPRFAEPAASLAGLIETAGREWVRRVSERQLGGRGYEMKVEGKPGSESAARINPNREG